MPTKMPFDDATISYVLTDVHFEMHTDDLAKHIGNIALDELSCSEGRHLSFSYPGEPASRWDCDLVYDFFFNSPEMVEPEDGFVGEPMLIHIIGTHPNGCRIQLSGDAWVHVDKENELVDGSFKDPPHIMVLSGIPNDDDREPVGESQGERSNVLAFSKLG